MLEMGFYMPMMSDAGSLSMDDFPLAHIGPSSKNSRGRLPTSFYEYLDCENIRSFREMMIATVLG
jgi:hypothetical protein